MGYARRHSGDFPTAGIALDRLGVGDARPTQPKPPRLQSKDVVAGDIGKHSRLRSSWGQREPRPVTTKGKWRPTSPCRPFGLPDFSREISLAVDVSRAFPGDVRGAGAE